jgi:hypothetical protein
MISGMCDAEEGPRMLGRQGRIQCCQLLRCSGAAGNSGSGALDASSLPPRFKTLAAHAWHAIWYGRARRSFRLHNPFLTPPLPA